MTQSFNTGRSEADFKAIAAAFTGRIAVIQASWHRDIVGQATQAFIDELTRHGLNEEKIEIFEVAGSLEIPLQARLLAETGRYDLIVAAGLIVDGGIYRHEFVAEAVLQGMMTVQLESRIPVLSVVLTPHTFQETDAHTGFFHEHFKVKGREAGQSCLQTLGNLQQIIAFRNSQADA